MSNFWLERGDIAEMMESYRSTVEEERDEAIARMQAKYNKLSQEHDTLKRKFNEQLRREETRSLNFVSRRS